MLNKRGVSLMEMLVYFGLSVLVLVVLFNFFWYGRRTFESGNQSFLAGTEAETAIRYLKNDLSSTSLGTVRAYPNPNFPTQAPGMTLASAHTMQDGTFKVNQYGAPLWCKHVAYTVESQQGKLALIRWENEYNPKDLLPIATPFLPSTQANKTHRRVLLRGIAPAGFAHKAMPAPLGQQGGFQVSFVRSDNSGEIKSTRPGESLSVWNPAYVAEHKPAGMTFAGNTRVVDVSLTFLLPDSTTGKESAVHLPFRVTPKN